jgi:hypothetical protein
MLALVASIHVLNTTCGQREKDVDGRDKPDHDEAVVFMGSGLRPSARPGKTAWFGRQPILRLPSLEQRPQAPLP